MLPNLAVLEKKCAELGLKVIQKGKRPAKQDFVEALREHFLPEGGLPYEEVTPMLCFAEWNLKPEEQKKIWESKKWVAQRKLNGCRIVLHFVEGIGVFAHSRTVSLKTYRYQELTPQLLIQDFVPDFSAVVDAEVIVDKVIDTTKYTAKGEVTKTSLHSTTAILHLAPESSLAIQREQDAPLIFHVFDIMSLAGKDLRKLLLSDRLDALEKFREEIWAATIADYFEFPPVVAEKKREFFQQVVDEGGEGVILKSLSSPYVDSSSRPRTGWVKVKRRQEYDAYVTGFIRGEAGTGWENLVGALEFSVMTENGEHALAMCSNLSMEARKKLSQYDAETNTVKLHPAAYGKVAEISGQDVSARSFRLSHATIDRWRPKTGPDAKTKDQCVISFADLKASAEWVGS